MQIRQSTHVPVPNADIRHILLDSAMSRAAQEHELLKKDLQDIFSQACSVRIEKDIVRLGRELQHLKRTVKEFMKEWNEHTRWEEEELFPYAAAYLGEEPDLFDYMEQEYELAEHFVRAFLHELDRSVIPVGHEDAYRMASYLLQAYAFLKNRFDEEEDILASLADRSDRFGY